LVLAEQPQGELVVLVDPPVADPAMSNRDPVAGLGPVRRAITFSAELPLDAGEATLGRTQVSRIGTVSVLPSLATTAANTHRPRSIPATRSTGGSGIAGRSTTNEA